MKTEEQKIWGPCQDPPTYGTLPHAFCRKQIKENGKLISCACPCHVTLKKQAR